MRQAVLSVPAFLLLTLGAVPSTLRAQVPHLVFGEVRSSSGTVPPMEQIAFHAYVQSRPADVLSEASPGQTGLLLEGSPPRLVWLVQCSDFASPWSAGDLLVVNVRNSVTGEYASTEVPLNSAPYQDAGILPLPVRLVLFEATWHEEGVVIRWQTTDELDCLGFFLWRKEDEQEQWTRVNEELMRATGGIGRMQEYRLGDRGAPRSTACQYRLEEVSRDGTCTTLGVIAVAPPQWQPTVFQIWPGYPNPSQATSVIRFSLARESPVQLTVVDVRGVTVRVLADGTLAAGEHLFHWDGTDAQGRVLPAGLYFCRVVASGQQHVHKILRAR